MHLVNDGPLAAAISPFWLLTCVTPQKCSTVARRQLLYSRAKAKKGGDGSLC